MRDADKGTRCSSSRRYLRSRFFGCAWLKIQGQSSGHDMPEFADSRCRSVEFRPKVLRDVEQVSMSTTILGKKSALPFAFAPTGFTRMMHTAGECAVARVAARAGIPYALSTVGTTTIEDFADASGDGRRWFQLYVVKDRERSRDMLQRARQHGFDALILTVDVPVGGARLRDVRSGLSVPPSLTWRTFLNGAMRPLWLYDFLTTPPPSFATLGQAPVQGGSTMQLGTAVAAAFDASVDFDDLAWFRDVWQGPIVVKGIQRVGPVNEDRVTGYIPPFEREDRVYQGVAGEGIAVDADGTVFAAEGPNSFVQAGGAFTRY